MEKDEKEFILKEKEIQDLIEWNEPNGDGCVASNKITKEGYKVGYMIRETPLSDFPDNGWRFMAGNEDDDYMSDIANHNVFAINTVCNYDRDIIPYLHAPIGTSFIRVHGGKFEEDDGSKPISVEMQSR